MRSSPLAFGAALFMTAALVAGCGATANGSSAAKAPIRVGLLAPFSGPEAFIGPDLQKGAQVAIAEINSHGGVLGRKLQLFTSDTGGDPVDAVPALSKLLSVDHIQALLGPSSLTVMAVLGTLEQAHMPTIAIGGTTQLDHIQNPYIFRSTPSDALMGTAMAYYAIKKGYTTAAVAFGTNSSAQTLKAPVVDAFTRNGGKIVANVDLVPDQSSYRSEIEQIFAKHPQVVFFQVDAQTGATLFKEMSQLVGLNTPFIGTDVTSASDFISAIGASNAAKVLTSIQGANANGAGSVDFAQYYDKVYHTSQAPVELANYAYDSMNVLALAMIKAGTTDSSAVAKAIREVANAPGTDVANFMAGVAGLKAGEKINYQGASGPMDFNQYGNVTGPFDAVASDSSGNLHQVMHIHAASLEGF